MDENKAAVSGINYELGQTNGLLSVMSETIESLEKVLDSVLLPTSPMTRPPGDTDDIQRSQLNQDVLKYNIGLSEMNMRLNNLINRVNL